MANVTKRAPGKWLGRYRGPDGKERSKTFPTKGEASAWAQQQELRTRSGEWTNPTRGRVPLDVFAVQWFEGLNVKPKTAHGYRSLYDTHVKPRWGEVRLDRIGYADVKTWVANLKTAPRTAPAKGVSKTRRAMSQPLSPARKKQAYQVLSMILDLAVEDGRLPRNPAKSASGSTRGMVPKAPKNTAHRYLSHENVHAIAEHIDTDSRALLFVLAYAGPRWGEATALQVQDVDLLRSRLYVRRAFSEVGGELSVSTTKTHATRTLPLPTFLRAELEALMVGKTTTDLIFSAPQGGPWRNSNFRARRFDPAVKATGLPGLKLHELRHTAASLAVQAGANVKAVQRMLGHSTATMTLDVYADLFDSDLEGVAARLDEAVARLGALGA
ncbi:MULTISPECIES: tyrosine-type recombinase/integrase [unclassified Nocardioides]|uniref:tyrosine-type recombinase/integrase n=1 Tax=unclassified Nocardioides TaxID=2615069 RepID=UPI0030142CDB